MLNKNERKKAMEYAVYMMMGSHFEKAVYDHSYEEKNMRICYALLSEKQQVDLEQASEKYFLEEVCSDLNSSFLNSEVRVRRFETNNENASIVFSDGGTRLWVVIKPGRRGDRPRFDHCILEEDTPVEAFVNEAA